MSLTPKKTGGGSEALKAVELRSDFYQEMKRATGFQVKAGAVALVVSLIILAFVLLREVKPNYFAVDAAGRITKMIPLTEPNVSDAAVANWLNKALVDSFTFSFADINYRLNDAATKWFTAEGGDELIKSINDSGNFDAVIEKKMFISFAASHTPLILKKGRKGNFYLWKLQVPGVLTYRTANDQISSQMTFTVIVSRRSVKETPDGLGIARIAMARTAPAGVAQ